MLTPSSSKSQSGFTLIELVVVIIILGILAVIALPKFINLSEDAQVSTVKGTAGAFKSGLDLSRAVWAVKVGSGPVEDLPVFGTAQSGEVDFNANGWPAQHYIHGNEASPKLDNVEDCISVWQVIFQGDEPSVSNNNNADKTDYKAIYSATATCTFNYRENTNLSIQYDSNLGSVTVDSDPNS
ncbi:type II secretion system protein [Shewanella kaireitica]|uniref:type II secretion system protein n=1 Tax=Shewanella kaireitica TaxID=212021 RepID=UPI00200E93D1|nr:prepilin-type N-terminal cleavage/methylation domain-containing protein [Shewanella kaireitica]MCL1092519.1 prepilin-type N-terminal cleavage/methylation domain-containing protein [Shewanella kaireitica]